MSREDIKFVPTSRADFIQANDLFQQALKYGKTGTQAIVDTVNTFGENAQQNNQAQIANYINGLSKEDLANRDAVLQGIKDLSKDSFMGYNMASVVDYLDKRPTALNTRARDDITTQTVVDDDIVNRASTALAIAKQGVLEAKSPEEKAQATDVFTTLSKALTPTDPYLAGRIADATIDLSDKMALRSITNQNKYNEQVDVRDNYNAGKVNLLTGASVDSSDPNVRGMYDKALQQYLADNPAVVLATTKQLSKQQQQDELSNLLGIQGKNLSNQQIVANIDKTNADTTHTNVDTVNNITNPPNSKNSPANLQLKAAIEKGLPSNLYKDDGTLNGTAVTDALFGASANTGNNFGDGVTVKYGTLAETIEAYRKSLKDDSYYSSPSIFGIPLGNDGDRFTVIQNVIDGYKDPETGKPLPEKMKVYIADRVFANSANSDMYTVWDSDTESVRKFIDSNIAQFKKDDADGMLKKKRESVTAQMQKFISANISPVVVMKAVGIKGKDSPNWNLFEPEWQQQFLQDQASQVAQQAQQAKPTEQKSTETSKQKPDVIKATKLQQDITNHFESAKAYIQAGDTKKAQEQLDKAKNLRAEYEKLIRPLSKP